MQVISKHNTYSETSHGSTRPNENPAFTIYTYMYFTLRFFYLIGYFSFSIGYATIIDNHGIRDRFPCSVKIPVEILLKTGETTIGVSKCVKHRGTSWNFLVSSAPEYGNTYFRLVRKHKPNTDFARNYPFFFFLIIFWHYQSRNS